MWIAQANKTFAAGPGVVVCRGKDQNSEHQVCAFLCRLFTLHHQRSLEGLHHLHFLVACIFGFYCHITIRLKGIPPPVLSLRVDLKQTPLARFPAFLGLPGQQDQSSVGITITSSVPSGSAFPSIPRFDSLD
jgi:hypothetical protein